MLYFAENSPRNSPYGLEWGGGANSLDSPKTEGNSDFSDNKNDADLNDNKQNDNASQEDAISEYTYKTYDDYFTDYNITAEKITEQDLTGSGTVADPYIVRSTRGFLWLTNGNLSGISLASKYLEIACDIILNDEIFDENGNPSGGDGVVYSWVSIANASNLKFNGNDFSISGYYVSDDTKEYVGLFYTQLSFVKNLKLKNFYLLGNIRVSALSSSLSQSGTIENVVVESGNIVGNGRLYGICFQTKELINCKNYANISQINGSSIKDNYAGLADTATYIKNCQNYGNIKTYEASYVGGIICSVRNGTIENCQNYGDIYKINSSACTGVGGVIGYVRDAIVSKCDNYGNIYNNYGNSAGICAYLYDIASYVKDCKNFGEIEKGGGIVGQGVVCDVIACENYGKMINSSGLFLSFRGKDKNGKETSIIKDCVVDCVFELSGVTTGIVGGNSSNNLEVTNCSITATSQGTMAATCGLVGGQTTKEIYTFKNVDIELDFSVSNDNFFLFYAIYGDAIVSVIDCSFKISNINMYLLRYSSGDFYAKNLKLEILSNTNCLKIANNYDNCVSLDNIDIKETIKTKVSKTDLFVYANKKVLYDGIVRQIDNGGQETREYYGTDFLGFYVDWKSGEIGLKTLSGNGFYQGSVTEEVLINKGFAKKEM